jgi:hypothetical protein
MPPQGMRTQVFFRADLPYVCGDKVSLLPAIARTSCLHHSATQLLQIASLRQAPTTPTVPVRISLIIMPKNKANKRPKKDAFSRAAVSQLLADFQKEDTLAAVARVCKMKIDDSSSMRSLARALMEAALAADRDQRKALAVLARRMHDRLPRYGDPGATIPTYTFESVVKLLSGACAWVGCRPRTPPGRLSRTRGANEERHEACLPWCGHMTREAVVCMQLKSTGSRQYLVLVVQADARPLVQARQRWCHGP